MLCRYIAIHVSVIQGEHSKCRWFKCSIAWEVRGIRMKIKCIFLCPFIKFLWSTLNSRYVFRGGTVSTEGHIIHVLKFMPHIFKHGGCNCSFISLYPCSKFQQRSAYCLNIKCRIYVPPEEEVKWCKLRRN